MSLLGSLLLGRLLLGVLSLLLLLLLYHVLLGEHLLLNHGLVRWLRRLLLWIGTARDHVHAGIVALSLAWIGHGRTKEHIALLSGDSLLNEGTLSQGSLHGLMLRLLLLLQGHGGGDHRNLDLRQSTHRRRSLLTHLPLLPLPLWLLLLLLPLLLLLLL